jgi:nicotinamidase-related amidase
MSGWSRCHHGPNRGLLTLPCARGKSGGAATGERRACPAPNPPRLRLLSSAAVTTPVIDPATTALVLIDLQTRIVGLDTAPHAGQDVVRRSRQLLQAFRARGGTIAVVRVHRPGVAEQPPGSDLVAEAEPVAGDIFVTKHSWGAFSGTDLDAGLRAAGVRTLVMAGLVTNFGVESTARAAGDLGYEMVLVEDAMSGLSADAHRFAVTEIFPLMGTVASTDEVLAALTDDARG